MFFLCEIELTPVEFPVADPETEFGGGLSYRRLEILLAAF